MAVLDVQNLTLSFGENTLFSNVSFDIKEKEKVGLIGCNGADGKPRELHIKKAVDVSKTVPPTHDIKPIGETEHKGGYDKQLITKCDLFNVERFEIKDKAEFETDGNSFMHILVIDGNGKIDGRNAKKGDSFLIPANHEKFEINGEIEFLATTI